MDNKRNETSAFSDKRMLSWSEASGYVGLGRTRTREFCEQIGAVRKIGRRILFDRYAIDRALDKQAMIG